MSTRITRAEFVQHAPDLNDNQVAGDAEDQRIAGEHFDDLVSPANEVERQRAVKTLLNSGRRAQREHSPDYALRAYRDVIHHAAGLRTGATSVDKLLLPARWNSALILEDRGDPAGAAEHVAALVAEGGPLRNDPLAHAKLAQLSLAAYEAEAPSLTGLRANVEPGTSVLEFPAFRHLERAAEAYAEVMRLTRGAVGPVDSALGELTAEGLREEAATGLLRAVSTYRANAGAVQNLAVSAAFLPWAERMVARKPELATEHDGMRNTLAVKDHPAFETINNAVTRVREAMGPDAPDPAYQLLFTIWLAGQEQTAAGLLPADIANDVAAVAPYLQQQWDLVAMPNSGMGVQVNMLLSQLGIPTDTDLRDDAGWLRSVLPKDAR